LATPSVSSVPRMMCSAPRQILHASAADQHARVLLQVVSDARDVCRDFGPTGQTHARHFAQRRIRLLRSRRVDADAHAASLWTLLQRSVLLLLDHRFAPESDELMNGRHSLDLQYPYVSIRRLNFVACPESRTRQRRTSRPLSRDKPSAACEVRLLCNSAVLDCRAIASLSPSLDGRRPIPSLAQGRRPYPRSGRALREHLLANPRFRFRARPSTPHSRVRATLLPATGSKNP
jgi:hypothetical protein